MPSIKMAWRGFDISDLEYEVRALVEGIEDQARQIIEEVVADAVDDMYSILVNAITETGANRAASGQGSGIAGRVDTGQMARDIKAAIETGMDGEIVGTWGWTENVKDYYLIQEYGSERIAAMSALQGSYMQARETLRRRLRDIGLEVN